MVTFFKLSKLLVSNHFLRRPCQTSLFCWSVGKGKIMSLVSADFRQSKLGEGEANKLGEGEVH